MSRSHFFNGGRASIRNSFLRAHFDVSDPDAASHRGAVPAMSFTKGWNDKPQNLMHQLFNAVCIFGECLDSIRCRTKFSCNALAHWVCVRAQSVVVFRTEHHTDGIPPMSKWWNLALPCLSALYHASSFVLLENDRSWWVAVFVAKTAPGFPVKAGVQDQLSVELAQRGHWSLELSTRGHKPINDIEIVWKKSWLLKMIVIWSNIYFWEIPVKKNSHQEEIVCGGVSVGNDSRNHNLGDAVDGPPTC